MTRHIILLFLILCNMLGFKGFLTRHELADKTDKHLTIFNLYIWHYDIPACLDIGNTHHNTKQGKA